MKKEHAAFAERLRKELVAEKIDTRPVELVKLLARYGGTPVTPQAISGWLHGKHLPKQANMRALARVVNMEPYDLQYGSKHVRGVRQPIQPWLTGIAAVDRLAMEEFLRLSSAQRRLIRDLIDMLAASEVQPKKV